MLPHHALAMLKRCTDLTNARLVKLIAHWHEAPTVALHRDLPHTPRKCVVFASPNRIAPT
jgi:hypothetical protein